MIDVELFGLDAGKHHLTNVVLHALNAVLLFAVLFRATKLVWRSAFVAALFAIHPLHVESVAWVAERKDVLSAFFLLLTILSYQSFVSSRQRLPYWTTVLFLAVGLSSKPMLVTAPFLLLLLDFWPLNRFESEGVGALVVEKVPFFVLSLASSAMTIVAQHAGAAIVNTNQLPLDARVSNALVSYVSYLAKAFWPINLSVFYPFPHQIPLLEVGAAILILLALTVSALLAAKRFPSALVGWLWFVVSLLPVIGIVQVGSQGLADRYTYIPLIGVFVAVTWIIADGGQRRTLPSTVLWAMGAGAVSLLTLQAHTQASYWRDELTLWQHAVDVSPGDSYTANGQVGAVLAQRGRQDEALSHFEAGVKSNPGFPDGHLLLGAELQARGLLDAAASELREAVRLRPDYPQAEVTLSAVLQASGKPDEAIDVLRATVQRHPDLFDAHVALASALFNRGQLDESIANWSAAIQMRPDLSGLRNNRGNALASLGNLAGAIEDFQEAIRLEPRSVAAHLSLAQALVATGKRREAASEYRVVLDLDPQNVAARQGLARIGG